MSRFCTRRYARQPIDNRGSGNPPRDGEILKAVPTILMVGPYRMYFKAMNQTSLPMPMWIATISRQSSWLDPLALARNLGFGPVELRRVHRLVAENRNLLLEKWHERFPS